MKSLLKNHWPLIGLGAMLLVVAFFFIRSGKDLFKTTTCIKGLMSGEGLSLKDIHYSQDDSDKKVKWVLDAKEVGFSGDKKTIRFYDFRLKVEPEGRYGFDLSGKEGVYRKDLGRIELRGELEGATGNGYRIFTDFMLINEKLGQLSTDSRVKIIGPFFTVSGTGLFADFKKERLQILSAVTTVIERESLR